MATTGDCVDGSEDCEIWASVGYCEEYSSFMQKLCQKSCCLCGKACFYVVGIVIYINDLPNSLEDRNCLVMFVDESFIFKCREKSHEYV